MFYSHEILTSPEHGVATVWLVATLGARSISRRLNRKTILDVDVPKACNAIIEPAAPMALRLQSNLLYGVSRVYSQQCGYTLLDAQAMHDKMRAMLRSVPAGGLDPSAGKARPDQLVLPYDPSFLPENNLPGLCLDLSKLNRLLEVDASQQSSVFLPRTPDLSQSTMSSSSGLQLNFPSDENLLRNMGELSSEADIASSVHGALGRSILVGSSINEDGGVLLQPDFEFDEDGNIIELGDRQQGEFVLPDEDIEMAITNEPARPARQPLLTGEGGSPVPHPQETDDRNEVTMRQRRRAPKMLPTDGQTALRNVELAAMNDDYIRNMSLAARNKRQNKIPTQAKKKAAYWVFGLGIGSVGAGVGASRAIHPLHFFSGDELYESLVPVMAGQKRSHEDDLELDARRVRAREEEEDHMGRIEPVDDNNFWNEDVELGRRASPALDDNSSQMPWNITASVQSSRHGSTVNIFRGFGSVSDFSSRGLPDSAGDPGVGPSSLRARSRLTSASPLAGRGFPYDMDRLIPGHHDDDDLDNLEGFDLSQYLEADSMAHNNEAGAAGESYTSQLALQNSLTESVMDQEGLNFLDFLAAKVEALSVGDDGGGVLSGEKQISFSMLLPPQKTSRAVATHGLMHTLALATKGFISVRQEPYVDQSSEEHGVKYEFGEIFLRLPEL
ncbi:Rec8 like protein-domain-containing protein [Aspergillus egyptiacus]|nr:Rec8 like protein-domain-containing protein [Aspergillus egyptiacus]